MVLINKDEKMAVLKRFPNEKFTRTCIQDSHKHKYYMTERPALIDFLESYRRRNVIAEFPPPPKKPKQNHNKPYQKKRYDNYQPRNRRWDNA